MASDNPIIVVTNIKGTETSISPNNNTNIITLLHFSLERAKSPKMDK
jgi:uncharacterized protein (DUF2235 family)